MVPTQTMTLRVNLPASHPCIKGHRYELKNSELDGAFVRYCEFCDESHIMVVDENGHRQWRRLAIVELGEDVHSVEEEEEEESEEASE